ncbi:MAG: hypothetical protein IPO64_02110 [Bacteroidetes bacterium]|nr:hypothetical protein [Bacteroidota bacterium]
MSPPENDELLTITPSTTTNALLLPEKLLSPLTTTLVDELILPPDLLILTPATFPCNALKAPTEPDVG